MSAVLRISTVLLWLLVAWSSAYAKAIQPRRVRFCLNQLELLTELVKVLHMIYSLLDRTASCLEKHVGLPASYQVDVPEVSAVSGLC